MLSEKNKKGLLREAQIMNQLRHQNICTFYGVCLDKPNYCLIMQLCNNSLENYINNTNKYH